MWIVNSNKSIADTGHKFQGRIAEYEMKSKENITMTWVEQEQL